MDFHLQNESIGEPHVTINSNVNSTIFTFYYPCPTAYNCTPYITKLAPGNYKFELFGAAGGYATSAKGGNGGISVGYYKVNVSTDAFIHIGGKGEDGPLYHNKNKNTPGGYNGGGIGGYDTVFMPQEVVAEVVLTSESVMMKLRAE